LDYFFCDVLTPAGNLVHSPGSLVSDVLADFDDPQPDDALLHPLLAAPASDLLAQPAADFASEEHSFDSAFAVSDEQQALFEASLFAALVLPLSLSLSFSSSSSVPWLLAAMAYVATEYAPIKNTLNMKVNNTFFMTLFFCFCTILI